MHGRLARAVGRGRARPHVRQVGGAARNVHDPAAPALDHRRREGAAAEVDAEHVHLERPPPLLGRVLRRRLGRSFDARVADEQVDRPGFARPALHVFAARHVSDERAPADLGGHRLDLLGRPPGHRDVHPGRRELAGDARADAAAAARDERRPSAELSRRHARSPPATRGSRARTGRPDPLRPRWPAPRGARSSPSASSAGRRPRGSARGGTPCRGRR